MISRSLVVAALVLCTCGNAALAQSPVKAGSGFGSPAAPVVGDRPAGPTARQELPPALPGSKADKGEAAPAQRPPADMPPNEALFDGINRGDTGAVRDALNRGADIDARNVLGLTPTALSVDLGRNDITFLLLSQRGAPTGADEANSSAGAAQAGRPTSGRTAERRGVASANPASEQTPRASRAARAAPAVAPAREAVRDASTLPQPSTPTAPQRQAQRQYAADGGTPIPQMGFLGFGGAAR